MRKPEKSYASALRHFTGCIWRSSKKEGNGMNDNENKNKYNEVRLPTRGKRGTTPTPAQIKAAIEAIVRKRAPEIEYLSKR